MKKVIFVFFAVFLLLFFIANITAFVVYSGYSFWATPDEYIFSVDSYTWPLPNHINISSYFGFRISPTTGTPQYHSGIDIPATHGTKIYSVSSGNVTFLDFYGANGYTIIIENSIESFQYSHVSPEFIIEIGEYINKGEHIGNVGPKYISDIENNPYHDSSGEQTNGATTGPHLHLSVKIDGQAIDPLQLFN